MPGGSSNHETLQERLMMDRIHRYAVIMGPNQKILPNQFKEYLDRRMIQYDLSSTTIKGGQIITIRCTRKIWRAIREELYSRKYENLQFEAERID